MSDFVTVAQSADIPDGAGECVRVAGRDIALFRTGEELHAIDNTCPHAGAPLCDGYLDGSVVTCPWHCWQFDVTNGECLTVSGLEVQRYPVRVENGEVQVQVEG